MIDRLLMLTVPRMILKNNAITNGLLIDGNYSPYCCHILIKYQSVPIHLIYRAVVHLESLYQLVLPEC